MVSLDGGLALTDLVLETLWAALSAKLLATVWALVRLGLHPARLRRHLAEIARPEVEHLPLRGAAMALVRAALEAGRPVVLVSRADQAVVDRFAAKHAIPGNHLGSDRSRDMAGAARAQALVVRFGAGGFDYLGHDAADLACWQAARQVLAAAPGARAAAALHRLNRPVETLDAPWTWASLLRAMRPVQWTKNVLLLLPALVEHDLSPARLLPLAIVMLGFCALTSSVYLVNDMLDLAADRRHPAKRLRPIASGALPIGAAMASVPGLLVLALILGSVAGIATVAVQLVYLLTATLYSLWLKHLPWLDLVALSALYVLRVVAGAAAAGLGCPAWPVAFSLAVFFVLSAVKRLTDLARMKGRGALPGRAYRRTNAPMLLAMALAGCAAAVGIFLAYTGTQAAGLLYANRGLLRLGAVPIALWLLRMIWGAWKGEEDYDPLDFVMHDRVGLTIAAVGLGLVFLSI